jgi:hypothetical protein
LDTLIFVQVCRTIDKNFSIFNSSIGSEEQMRAMETTKGGLCCKKEVLKKEVLKTRGPEEADVIRSTLLRSWSPEPDVIRS